MPGDSPVGGAGSSGGQLNPLGLRSLEALGCRWHEEDQREALDGHEAPDGQACLGELDPVPTPEVSQYLIPLEMNGNHLYPAPPLVMGCQNTHCHVCNTSLEMHIQLEQGWRLWQQFLKAHSHFGDWLRLAESSAANPNSAQVPYITAKEELRKFEGLQREVRARLSQLQSMNMQYRCLARVYGCEVGTKLQLLFQDSSQRWDLLSRTVDNVCRRLKHFVNQREEFESEREDIAIWLAELNLRLTEVEHFSGNNSSEKMKELQTFQVLVGENAERLTGLLEWGERLIQRSEPGDAEEIEEELQELLLYCARVFDGVARLHTRLLSMRLVFEEDLLLDQHSGSDSEAQWEDEGIYDRSSVSDPQRSLSPAAGLGPGSSLDSLALEWDPSVDVGGSGSHDDADSSYFSVVTGLPHKEDSLSKDTRANRRSFLSSLGSQSDVITADVGTECDVGYEGSRRPGPSALPGSLESGEDSPHHISGPRLTSSGHLAEPVTFDPERISAWLGQTESPLPQAPRALEVPAHGEALETDDTRKCFRLPQEGMPCVPGNASPLHLTSGPAGEERSARSRTQGKVSDANGPAPWSRRRRHPDVHPGVQQVQDKSINCPGIPEVKINIDTEAECVPQSRTGRAARRLHAPVLLRLAKAALFLFLSLALVLALLRQLPAGASDPRCHRANTFARSLRLMLHYVNGPPPT
ncbi:nesprin-2 isoform X1 [Lepisosteus oculatus]|uniref:nesprin-2 isoform X1 n=1 Tax=Lepisosteus oculatus TaxID=7918 RepID=UPI00372117C6